MSEHHKHRVAVRWSDFDRYGHMMNANYVEIAQEARLSFAQAHIFPSIPTFAAFVRHLELDYKNPIAPQGLAAVEVETWVTRVGNSSFTTRQNIRVPDGPVACEVECVQVAVDMNSGLPRPLTQEERDIISSTPSEILANSAE
ncbi:acyl-CoA thioesterase [Corynebacterium lizhenjunii]|uniref:Acyl-CoA thioesterase n=1 Tax=Corynebacterium lizhenjunii TaxID=2709394 RepID=A0A7T0KDX1_9CORY|nr:thioesterase family protein [Corynebacterium lizhenjunii]QPK78802.1 acyl-CoA thioesterase [Corynebacterium lizhenjunii]